MQEFRFKTNINCSGCVANITPYLEQETDICDWNVDTANPQKLLTVTTEKLTETEVMDLVQKAGYKAERL